MQEDIDSISFSEESSLSEEWDDIMSFEEEEDQGSGLVLVDMASAGVHIATVEQELLSIDKLVRDIDPSKQDIRAIYTLLRKLWLERGLLVLHKKFRALESALGANFPILMGMLNSNKNHKRYARKLCTYPGYVDRLAMTYTRIETKTAMFAPERGPDGEVVWLPGIEGSFYRTLILNIHIADMTLLTDRFLRKSPELDQIRGIAILIDKNAFHYQPRKDQPESMCLFLRFHFRYREAEQIWDSFILGTNGEEIPLTWGFEMPYQAAPEIITARDWIINWREMLQGGGKDITPTDTITIDVWAHHPLIGRNAVDYPRLCDFILGQYDIHDIKFDWYIGHLMSHATLGVENQELERALEQFPAPSYPEFVLNLGISTIPSSFIPQALNKSFFATTYRRADADWVPLFPGLSFWSRLDRPGAAVPYFLGNLYRSEPMFTEDGQLYPKYDPLKRSRPTLEVTTLTRPFDYYVQYGRQLGAMADLDPNLDPQEALIEAAQIVARMKPLSIPLDAEIYAERAINHILAQERKRWSAHLRETNARILELTERYEALQEQYDEQIEQVQTWLREREQELLEQLRAQEDSMEARMNARAQGLAARAEAKARLQEMQPLVTEAYSALVTFKENADQEGLAVVKELVFTEKDQKAIQARKNSRRALERIAKRALAAAPGPMTPSERGAFLRERLSRDDAMMRTATDGTIFIMGQCRTCKKRPVTHLCDNCSHGMCSQCFH